MKLKIIIVFLLNILNLRSADDFNSYPVSLNFEYLKTSDKTNIAKLTDEQSCCPFEMNGNGNSYSLGLSYNFKNIFGINHLNFFFAGNFVYNNSFIYYNEIEKINVNGEPYDGLISHSIDFNSSSIKPEIGFKYSYSSIFVKYKVGVDVFVNNNFTQKEEIIAPSDRGVFADTQTRTRNVVNSSMKKLSIPISNSFVFGFSIDYKSRALINPGLIIGFRNSISNIYDWTNQYYGLSIDIEFLR